MNEYAKQLLTEITAPNSELEYRIQANTDLYRKGWGRLWLFDKERILFPGKAEIRLRQLTHEYKFGANLFMLGQFSEPEKNALFEERFKHLFNLGVAPLYWSDLEPEDGNPRFAADSRPVYRRPPPDAVLDFCEKNHIAVKGHPLCWNNWLPSWLPEKRDAWLRRLDRRIREIAERYAGRIFLFDAVNEIFSATRTTAFLLPEIHRPEYLPYERDIVETVFRIAEKYFTPGHRMLLNDDCYWWIYHREYSPLFQLAQRLLDRGVRLGGLGFQFHMFKQNLPEAKYFLNPEHLYACLDNFHRLGIPCNFSEVSLAGSRDLGDGDTFQKILADRLYRLWFSHPATDSIVWWNPVDGTAAGGKPGDESGENSLRAGLFRFDLSLKPAAEVLEHLIRHEWHTETTLDYEHGGDNRFHGFYGDYEAEIKTDRGTFRKRISLSNQSSKDIKIMLDNSPVDSFPSFWH